VKETIANHEHASNGVPTKVGLVKDSTLPPPPPQKKKEEKVLDETLYDF
jgi:hypothetical protein